MDSNKFLEGVIRKRLDYLRGLGGRRGVEASSLWGVESGVSWCSVNVMASVDVCSSWSISVWSALLLRETSIMLPSSVDEISL